MNYELQDNLLHAYSQLTLIFSISPRHHKRPVRRSIASSIAILLEMASGFDAADQKIILQAVENVLEWWREEIATEGEAIAGERKARVDLLFFRYDAIAWEVLNYDHGDLVDAFLRFIADDVALKLEKAGTVSMVSPESLEYADLNARTKRSKNFASRISQTF